ncbi:MAG: hypothetical protein H6Q27_859 [Ignavibacteriaceae bacterium]|nr:hypothetical protein [Ignavibacteriaceae bacterium]
MKKYFNLSLAIILVLSISCGVNSGKKELKSFPVDDLNGIPAQSGIQIDKSISSDGNGSIKIEANNPVVIALYSVNDIQVEDAQIIYEAKVKSESLNGQALLEMWCVFNDKGEFFSRGFDSVISGTSDWRTIKTVFNLRKGEMPDQIKLNIMVNGVGTVWIDDIHLSKL